MLSVNQTSQVLQFLEGAKRIVCITHANPDGDALGSMLGFAAIIRQRFPKKDILCICKDPAPAPLRFLPGAASMQKDVVEARGDLVVFLDAADPKQTEFHETHASLFSEEGRTKVDLQSLKLDHHPALSDFATLNIVDTEASSTAEIVLDIAESLDMILSKDAATCLLTGIYTDTGSFMHSNTSVRVYRNAAKLLRSGADQRAIVQNIFRTSKVSTLKLWGRVLEKISLAEEGGAVSAVTAGDFRATGADFSELTGAIDYLNSIPGMKFSLVLSERNGKVKGSLRTLQDDVDVSAMAQKFAGGGHKKAAGFSINGALEEERRWKVVPKTSN